PLKRGTVRSDKYGEEEFDREEQPAAQDDEAIRQSPREAQGDRARQEAADGGTLRRDSQAGRVAAQFVGDTRPQSVRTDRAPARLFPQASPEPYRAAGPRVQGAHPRPSEVELVRRVACL